jgi:hypothetical protein
MRPDGRLGGMVATVSVMVACALLMLQRNYPPLTLF